MLFVYVFHIVTERSQSVSSSAGGDRRSTALDTIALMRKRESAAGGQAMGLPQAEGAKDESVGAMFNYSFRPVTLTVQSFFKQVINYVQCCVCIWCACVRVCVC